MAMKKKIKKIVKKKVIKMKKNFFITINKKYEDYKIFK